MTSLFDDLTSDLIAENRQRVPKPEWKPSVTWTKPSVTWTFTGYLARCTETTCLNCRTSRVTFEGIYSEEVGSNGTRKLSAASQWPVMGSKRVEMSEAQTPYCWACLGDFGFDDLVAAPNVATNVAGQGLLGIRHG